MLEKINDVTKALETGAYLSALALALTLPDVCGKLKYPSAKSKQRYTDWFDEYYTPFHNPDYSHPDAISELHHPDKMPRIDGQLCYKLRCAFLHEGNTKEVPVTRFLLCINGASGGGIWWSNNDPSTIETHVEIDVASFCKHLLETVERFYDENKEAFDFSDAHIEVIDWESPNFIGCE